MSYVSRLALALLTTAPLALANDLPVHPPLRTLIVSDEVNPHGLSDAELTQPGDLHAAFTNPAFGLTLDSAPDAVLEVGTNDIHLATAALSVPPHDASAYDVVVYFAHRIPNDASSAQNIADQDAFTTAVVQHLVDGGGFVCFHHGAYTASGKAGILDVVGATASSVSWNTSVGQTVIDVAPGHFITTHSVEPTTTRSYADVAFGVPAGTYPAFVNLPDERYPAFSINASAGDITPLFASDYAQSGSTHVLGFVHDRPEWAGRVVVYQPGEHQPQALDDTTGNNAQILANALVFAANTCSTTASVSSYGTGLTGTLGIPDLSFDAAPRLGTTTALQLGNSLGSPTTGRLLVGFAQAVLPTKGGAVLVAPPWIELVLPLPAAGLALPAAFPLDAGLCGIELDLQLIVAPDPGAVHNVAFSRGLACILGE